MALTTRRDAPASRHADLDVPQRATRSDPPTVVWKRAPLRILPGLAVALSVAAVGLYLAVALARVGSPAELEWMEGGIAQHVQRVLDGHSVYVRPSIAFTPYLYTPLFYYVGAAFRAVLGAGLWPLRLVSLLSSLALLGAVARLVQMETRSRWAAATGAGVMAALFAASGAWLDLARVDTLCLALMLWSLALVRSAGSARGVILAGALAAAAVMTKQVALLPAAAVLPFLWRRDRKLAIAYAGAMTVGIGTAAAVLQATSGGWFLFYAVLVPLHHQLVSFQLTRFWTTDLFGHLWPVALIIVAPLAVARRPRSRRVSPVPDGWFLGPVIGALVATSYLSRLHSGGYDNVLLPAFAGLAVLIAIAVFRLDATVVEQRGGGTARVLAAVPVLLLFATLAYNPLPLIPTTAAASQAQGLEVTLRALPQPVYMPGHPMYLAAAGMTALAPTAAVDDVLRADIGSTGRDLVVQLETSVRDRLYGALVVDSEADLTILPIDVCRYYYRVGPLARWWRLLPVTGTPTAPETVWLARPAPLDFDPIGCPRGSLSRPSAAASG